MGADMAASGTRTTGRGRLVTPAGLAWPQPPLHPGTGRSAGRLPAAPGNKQLASLDAAFDACGIRDGATLSFHHHFRNGDQLVNRVLERAASRGLRDLTVACSSIFPVHAPMVELIRAGVVTRIATDYLRGPVADAVIAGALPSLVLLQSHGGRARAIAADELPIDVAFVAAPLAARNGAATGRAGRFGCGPLGYAMVDAAHAARTVVVADAVVAPPLPHTDIPAEHVDHVVAMDGIGDPAGIQSGATVPVDTPQTRLITRDVVAVLRASGLLVDGFSFQTGAGGASLFAVAAIGAAMRAAGIRGGFVAGGIAAAHVEIVRQGLAERIRDVQSFDLVAVESAMRDPWHEIMSAEAYASPGHPAPAVDELSLMLLGAAEVDAGFNVNVAVGGDGRLIGGPGGHPDTAEGARLTIVTTALTGGGFAKLVDEVACIVTPGKDVDVVVTDHGIAVNPARPELARRLRDDGIDHVPIDALIARARSTQTRPRVANQGQPRVVIENRNGGILDVIRSP